MEAPKITQDWDEDPLMEYVVLLADTCFPFRDLEGFGPSVYPERFLRRLSSSSINFYYTYDDYLNAEKPYDIYNIIQALGIDVERFWYLLLFVIDLVDGAFYWKDNKLPTPKEEITALGSKILKNIKVKKFGELAFNKKMELVLNIDGEKHGIRVKSERALFFLAHSIEKLDINTIHDLDTRLCLSLMDCVSAEQTLNDSEADSPKIAYFTRLMREFLYNIAPDISEKNISANSLSPRDKMFLISKLVRFTRLSTDKRFDESSQRLKDLWKQPTYKNIPLNKRNKYYTL